MSQQDPSYADWVLSCKECINFHPDTGCPRDIYQYCRNVTPKHRPFFNVDVRTKSEEEKRNLQYFYDKRW